MTFCASKTVNGVTTNHIWDGSNIVAETDGNKQVTAKYYRGSGLISQVVSNTESYYQFNMHGDVIGLTGANGEKVEAFAYDAFGNQLSEEETSATPFRYNGEYYDEETGFTYLRARYYDPTTGRFIQEDPIKDGSNWYTYCVGNPVNYFDSNGLWMEGDEKLSDGAQTYTTYYGEQWEIANAKLQASLAAGDKQGVAAARLEMHEWNAKANDIRYLDSQGLVSGTTLSVPVYNQYNTAPHDYTNELCWATSSAMVASLQLGDTVDRTLMIAIGEVGSTLESKYNKSNIWKSTDTLGLGITAGQTQTNTTLSMSEIQNTIDAGNPFGVLYGASYVDASGATQWSGHWVVGVGYATAPGHEALVVSNDPADGIQRIQTYSEFQTYVDGWRVWTETAQF